MGIKEILDSWAAWVHRDKLRLGYPKYSISVPYQCDYAYEYDKRAEWISDEEGMRLDRIIKGLEAKSQLQFDALAVHYLCGRRLSVTVDVIGAEYGRRGWKAPKGPTVEKYISLGENWVDGALSALCCEKNS